jgi:hypothetical protein
VKRQAAAASSPIPNAFVAERVARYLSDGWLGVAAPIIQRAAYYQRMRHRSRCIQCKHVIPRAFAQQKYCSRKCKDRAYAVRKEEARRIIGIIRGG